MSKNVPEFTEIKKKFAFCEFYTSATASDRLSDAVLKNVFLKGKVMRKTNLLH